MSTDAVRAAVVGSGYVGTTLAACLAEFGHDVAAIDIDPEVVASINDGRTPVDEPGLDELIATHAGNRLVATGDHGVVAERDITFVAVETPSNPDGSLDTGPLLAAIDDTLAALEGRTEPHVLVIKSTVLPDVIAEEIEPAVAAVDAPVSLAVNPEFLREGTAVADLLDPDKLVFGSDDDRAIELLRRVFAPLIAETDAVVVETDPQTASMIKYANNAFLAAKISLINDLGNICKDYGLDTYEVADAIGLDGRINEQFLRSGVGWGGSCFVKDVSAITHAANQRGYDAPMLTASQTVNRTQPERLLALLDAHVDVAGRPVAVLGLAFKPDTDDIRGSRALPVIEGLTERGASVRAYDPNPGAVAKMRETVDGVTFTDSLGEALEGAVGACVVTDWPEFADLGDHIDVMAEPVVIDGRRIVEPTDGMRYEGLTW